MRNDEHRSDEHTDRASLWVLHVLDADEEAEFLAHLEGDRCADCAAVVAETAGTLEALARAVPQEEPPADLRYRLLAAAEVERPVVDDVPVVADVPPTGSPRGSRLDGRGASRARPDGSGRNGSGPAPQNGTPPAPPAPSTPPAADERSATVVPFRRRPVVRRALTAVAAAAAVVVIGGLVTTNQSLRDERDQQTATAQEYDRIVDVMRDAGAPGAVSAPLAEPGGALVGLVVDQGSGPEVLTTALGANRTDETYVLWALTGTAPTAVGTFDVPGGAASVRSVPSTAPVGPVGGYAVSLEPGRSAPAAPTRIVASGQVGR